MILLQQVMYFKIYIYIVYFGHLTWLLTPTNLVPSGNVPSTCTSSMSSPTPGNTWFSPIHLLINKILFVLCITSIYNILLQIDYVCNKVRNIHHVQTKHCVKQNKKQTNTVLVYIYVHVHLPYPSVQHPGYKVRYNYM